jgi:hypothetical protein
LTIRLVNFRFRQGNIAESWSRDQGRSWSKLGLIQLPNPDSGIDGVVLHDGRALFVYNHSRTARSPLNVALSPDGKNWQVALTLGIKQEKIHTRQ